MVSMNALRPRKGMKAALKCLIIYLTILQLGTHVYCFKYRYKTNLDKQGLLFLRWDVDYRRDLVFFSLTANINKSQGFGFGFSDYGEPTNADFILYWSEKQLIHHFQFYLYKIKTFKQFNRDAWSDKDGILHVDRQQDYKLSSRRVRKNKVILEFERKFLTCDTKDYNLDNGTTHLVFFVASNIREKPLIGRNVSDFKVGIQRVQLLKPDIEEPQLEPGTWTIDITAPSVINPDEIIHYYNGPGMAEGKPPELAACRKVIGAWAMGAKALSLPNEAGTPIGGPWFSKYVLLEIHYNNPELKQGIVDSSGIRFYVTPKLRKYDAGIMELGLEYTNKMAIPPGQNLFHLTGYCIAECTNIGLPHKGINIFASQLHTHLTGKKVYTKHVRDGTELPELNRDNHYSPHYQEIRALPEPVQILPGDALITTCEDSTLDRENVTVGGFSISQEMCVNYVHYYPRCDLESPLSMQCNQSNGERFPGYWEGKAVTRIDRPLTQERNTC
ncbi:hypothetical protein KUTeg_022032 [Tegillarca granosa]|uniref:DOMON domain-containing protein n=1 Tax=Tegillarca granosa TaxID=220873 RepID=A0ABQ9E524_TEGGR|nr:hypothetical protein KUTeg_022032 [Tegillarca granosa]